MTNKKPINSSKLDVGSGVEAPPDAAAMPVASLDDAIVSIAWLAAVPSMTSAPWTM